MSIIFFHNILGPPTPVSELLASQVQIGVQFTWSPSFSAFSLPVVYQIQVEEESTEEVLHNQNNITSTSFLFTSPGNFCSVILFKIQGLNRAGNSAISELVYGGYTGISLK